eukprot:scaffold706_cov418-Prasinococcus_capsulatus_cf.AAC.16
MPASLGGSFVARAPSWRRAATPTKGGGDVAAGRTCRRALCSGRHPCALLGGLLGQGAATGQDDAQDGDEGRRRALGAAQPREVVSKLELAGCARRPATCAARYGSHAFVASARVAMHRPGGSSTDIRAIGACRCPLPLGEMERSAHRSRNALPRRRADGERRVDRASSVAAPRGARHRCAAGASAGSAATGARGAAGIPSPTLSVRPQGQLLPAKRRLSGCLRLRPEGDAVPLVSNDLVSGLGLLPLAILARLQTQRVPDGVKGVNHSQEACLYLYSAIASSASLLALSTVWRGMPGRRPWANSVALPALLLVLNASGLRMLLPPPSSTLQGRWCHTRAAWIRVYTRAVEGA